MQKTALICLALITAAAFAQAQSETVQFTAFYGINHHLEYGSVEDFV